MQNDFLFAEHTKCASAHRYSIYIFEHTWIQMSNCIINRANTSACFVAYSPARTLYILRLRCRWRCWCLKIRQEIICRHTHTHAHVCSLTGKVENLKAMSEHTILDLLCWRRELMWKRALFLSTRRRFICLPSHNACCCTASPPPPHSAQHWFIYVQFIKRHF